MRLRAEPENDGMRRPRARGHKAFGNLQYAGNLSVIGPERVIHHGPPAIFGTFQLRLQAVPVATAARAGRQPQTRELIAQVRQSKGFGMIAEPVTCRFGRRQTLQMLREILGGNFRAETGLRESAGRYRKRGGTEQFDQVIFACHSDQTLMMLGDADNSEQSILGMIRYQANETILHCDASVLPLNRRAWAAWNADIPGDPGTPCTVSYCMNILQGIDSPEPFIVSLNQRSQIDPSKIFAVMQYHHPVYDHAMVRAQSRRHEIQGKRRSWFCGAYWGFGFHEDGFRSGHEVAEGILAL